MVLDTRPSPVRLLFPEQCRHASSSGSPVRVTSQEEPPGFCLPLRSAAARATVETSPHHLTPRMRFPLNAVVKAVEAWAGRTFPLKSAPVPSADPLHHHSALWSMTTDGGHLPRFWDSLTFITETAEKRSFLHFICLEITMIWGFSVRFEFISYQSACKCSN